MNPGKLDRRIVIQKRVMTKDATGTRVETWADESSVWAQYVTNKGNETSTADAERETNSQQFRIRYRALNAIDYRIFYRSQFYDIIGISEEGRQSFLLVDSIATRALA
jgi:SPP1 family predicted phage head-tail adaptor